MRKRVLMIFTALLAMGALLITGCQIKPESAQEIVAKMKAAESKITSYSATVENSFIIDGQTQTMVIKQWVKKPNMFRMEGEFVGEGGVVTVSNGKQMWNYSKKENTVTVFEFKGEDIPDPKQDEKLLTQFVTDFITGNDVEVLDQQQVAGRNTFVLKITSKEERQSLFRTMKVWVDTEMLIPLKTEIYKDGNLMARTVYKDVQLVDLPDSLFTFDTPPGAKVVAAPEFKPQKLTLPEAQKAVDFTVFVPAYLPAGVQLKDVDKIDLGDSNALLVINFETNDNKAVFNIMQSKPKDRKPMPGGEKIKINGQEGNIMSGQDFTMIQWEQQGTEIVLSGSFDKATMLKIAESLK